MEQDDSAKKAIVYVASQELAKISSLLPSNKQRSNVVHSLVNSLGLMNDNASKTARLLVVTPKRASYKDLSLYHTRDYLDIVLDPKFSELNDHPREFSINEEFGLQDDCPGFAGLSEYVQLIGGATLTAVSALQQNVTNVAICWDGGRHHARKSQASGYCYVADCILAILVLKRPNHFSSSSFRNTSLPVNSKPRIMYLDLDLHFSDAVSEAFYLPMSSANSQILTLSVHHASPGFFPSSIRAYLPHVCSEDLDPFTLSIPLQHGASDSTFKRIWSTIERVMNAFVPDFVVVQCGLDGLAGDPCSTFNWSLGGSQGSLGWCIEKIIKEWPGKKLLLGGGGYNSANAARAWAYLTSVTLENPLSLDTEIPDHPGFPLYAPSFTLDVPAGNMFDRNTEEYLVSVEKSFDGVIDAIKDRLISIRV